MVCVAHCNGIERRAPRGCSRARCRQVGICIRRSRRECGAGHRTARPANREHACWYHAAISGQTAWNVGPSYPPGAIRSMRRLIDLMIAFASGLVMSAPICRIRSGRRCRVVRLSDIGTSAAVCQYQIPNCRSLAIRRCALRHAADRRARSTSVLVSDSERSTMRDRGAPGSAAAAADSAPQLTDCLDAGGGTTLIG